MLDNTTNLFFLAENVLTKYDKNFRFPFKFIQETKALNPLYDLQAFKKMFRLLVHSPLWTGQESKDLFMSDAELFFKRRKSKLKITTSAEDWTVIRECYVKSFFNYPLYTYIVPNPEKRETFLRTYLDANFEVTVGSGRGLLLALHLNSKKKDAGEESPGTEAHSRIIGGVLLVFPGFMLGNDNLYWKAYDDHKLGDISAIGLSKVKKYETWENDHIYNKINQTDAPIFNGLFCAMHPRFTSNGLGKSQFEIAVKMLYRFWLTFSQSQIPKSPSALSSNSNAAHQDNIFVPNGKKLGVENSKHKASSSLRGFSLPVACNRDHEQLLQNPVGKSNVVCSHDSEKDSILDFLSSVERSKCPVAIGICQSPASEKFYTSNGFRKIFETTYTDQEFSFPVSMVAVALSDSLKSNL